MSEDGVHLHIIVTARTKHVYHLTHDIAMILVWPLRYLHHSLVIGLASLELVFGNKYVVHENPTLRIEKRDILAHGQFAHEYVLGAFEYLDHLRLLDVFLPSGIERYAHTVARER